MEIDLQTLFYGLGVAVFISQIIFFIALGVGAWYAYKTYRFTKNKIASTPALFLAKKVIGNPMKIGSGLMVVQLLSGLFKLFKDSRKKR